MYVTVSGNVFNLLCSTVEKALRATPDQQSYKM